MGKVKCLHCLGKALISDGDRVSLALVAQVNVILVARVENPFLAQFSLCFLQQQLKFRG